MDWVGRVIDGRFPLLEWLGGSDRSGVFLTELDRPGSQRVAIKLVPANYANAQAQLVRWTEQAELSHPHVLKLLHTGRSQVETTGVVYSVTEYAEEVLADVLKDRALEPDEVKEMLVPVLDALFYLHGRGYVHGSLKPTNLLVVRNHLRLSGDCLQIAGEPGRRFRALTVYDGPESGEAMMAPSADVWSLGMLLIAALTKKPLAWDRESGKEPMIPESIPEPLARMVRGCLRMEAARRYSLMDLNKARFEKVRSTDEPVEKSGWTAAEADPDAQVKRRGRMVIVAGVVVAVGLAIFGMTHFGGSPESGSAQSPEIAGKAAGPAHAAKPDAEKPSAGIPETASAASDAAPAAAVSARSDGGGAEVQAASGDQRVPRLDADSSAAVVQRVLPEAPRAALESIHGTVRVRVRVAVDASGKVTNAAFANAGPSRYFANMALDAARQWRFAAGAAGERVVEFDFQPTGVEAAAQ